MFESVLLHTFVQDCPTIPKAKVQTEEQLDQVLTILNKMNSPEAGPIINNGIEGVHYTLEESDYANAVIDPTAPYVSDTYVAKGAQIDLIVGDARLKYLAGQISKDDLISEIARWHAEGGDAILEELNTLAAADK